MLLSFVVAPANGGSCGQGHEQGPTARVRNSHRQASSKPLSTWALTPVQRPTQAEAHMRTFITSSPVPAPPGTPLHSVATAPQQMISGYHDGPGPDEKNSSSAQREA